jgi:hypothetical protein
MARAVDFAVPLASYTLLPLLDRCLSPHSPYRPSKLAVKLVRCVGADCSSTPMEHDFDRILDRPAELNLLELPASCIESC